jgi:hypothetical protein
MEGRWIEGEEPPANPAAFETGSEFYIDFGSVDAPRPRLFKLRFWMMAVEGRWEPVGIRVYAPDFTPISASDMRALPWGRLVDHARPGETWFARTGEREVSVYTDRDFEPVPESVIAEPALFVTSRPKRAGGRKPKYGREHFEEVARIYRLAYSRNRTPTRAVARHFDATAAQAAKWVARSRQMGLLPRTARGKARATPPERKDGDRHGTN